MPDWLVPFLVGNGSGGILVYLFRAKVDDHFAARAEGRQYRREDLKELRDALVVFLGELRAHLTWLVETPSPQSAGGEPSPQEKARMIGEWTYSNSPRFTKARRKPPYLIRNVAYQLALGDRHFLEERPNGYELLEEAWDDLEDYAKNLIQRLHGDD